MCSACLGHGGHSSTLLAGGRTSLSLSRRGEQHKSLCAAEFFHSSHITSFSHLHSSTPEPLDPNLWKKEKSFGAARQSRKTLLPSNSLHTEVCHHLEKKDYFSPWAFYMCNPFHSLVFLTAGGTGFNHKHLQSSSGLPFIVFLCRAVLHLQVTIRHVAESCARTGCLLAGVYRGTSRGQSRADAEE